MKKLKKTYFIHPYYHSQNALETKKIYDQEKMILKAFKTLQYLSNRIKQIIKQKNDIKT